MMMFANGRRAALTGSAAAALMAALAAPVAAHAQAAAYAFDIPAQDLGSALREFGRQSRQQIVFDGALVKGKTSAALKGSFSAEAALSRLLEGTGLHASRGASGVLVITGEETAAAGAAVTALVVTGTRIKGVPPSSPVLSLGSREIQDSGLTSVGDVIRSIPQNFAGGQNPGVLPGASGRNMANQNISGGSSFNLRGLGPDATLTLLNGRRLSYEGFSQAVDVSIIPLQSIEQIQIVADGASAIYGSDAVAGVANIILKRNFEGVAVSGRYGFATDGGDRQTAGDVVAGHAWSSGELMVAADVQHQSPIYARQRSVGSNVSDPYNFLYDTKQSSALVTARQDLTDRVTFSLDGLASQRRISGYITYPTSRYINEVRTKQWTLSPTLDVRLGGGWTASLNGLLGRDNVEYHEPSFNAAGVKTSDPRGCYCDRSQQLEADAEGPVFSLPAGAVRLALGAGYRKVTYADPSETGNRTSRYAFAEVNLPLVSPDMSVPAVERLSLNGAVRHERYADLGDISTPKFGIVYQPFADLELKASWGKSFKAPTLLQQYQPQYVAVFPASSFGTGFAPTAQALLIGGGGPQLKPERATTFTATAVYKPSALPGFSVEATAFRIDYTDRVVSPLANFAQTFSDPIYARFVHYNPTLAQQQALIQTAKPFYSVGPVYDGASVIAIVDDGYTNAARQKIDGVDLTVRQMLHLSDSTLQLLGTASWLKETQQVTAGAATIKLTGTLYNPPSFRARAGAIWTREALTLSAYVNNQSSLTNPNVAPAAKVKGQTTLDLAGLYRPTGDGGVLRGLELSVAMQNVFDAKPPYVTPLASYIPAFDSNNYSVVGRFVSLTITKRW